MLALAVAACGGSSEPDGADGLQPVPDEAATRAVKLYPGEAGGSTWCVLRTWPDERIRVFSGCDGESPVPQRFTRGGEGELLVFAAAESGPHLYLLVYDARRNIPGGRIPGLVDEGVDVVRFDGRDPGGEPTVMATKLPLGGFDRRIEVSADGAGILACGARECLQVTGPQQVLAWSDPLLGGYEIVEVLRRDSFVDLIVRSVDDGNSGAAVGDSFHYAWARLDATGVRQLRPIAPDCVPYRLAGTGATDPPTWSCARTPAELADLFRHDLARMPAGGRMDFGTNNAEGRIAWSQAYYLNGLLELTGPHLATLGAQLDQTKLRARVAQEVGLLVRLAGEPQVGYASRRYSMRRGPITFALHLGRVARTVALARERGIAVDQDAVDALVHRMWALQDTVEAPVTLAWRGRVHDTLGYRPGIEFWCDGANVPHNYVTGYLQGLMALAGDTTAVRERAQRLLAPLLTYEPLADATTWSYWWATAYDGWSAADGVSVNTPAYAGFKGAAHITYRGLDAIALLRLSSLVPDAVPGPVVQNLRQLVANGGLLPWVNGELARTGQPVRLTRAAAYRHARSAGSWEIEAQVWALERLAREP